MNIQSLYWALDSDLEQVGPEILITVSLGLGNIRIHGIEFSETQLRLIVGQL